jgi:DNA polymerase III epsilon subunit-like protein
MARLLFFDLETGGFQSDVHAVLEIAARVVDTDSGEFAGDPIHCLVRPVGVVTPEAVAVHGIQYHHADENGLLLSEVVEQLHALVMETKPEKLAGHNVDFDIRFLRVMVGRAVTLSDQVRSGSWLPAGKLCTLELARTLRKQRRLDLQQLKLGSLAEHLGVELVSAHSAWHDINATIEVYKKLKVLSR